MASKRQQHVLADHVCELVEALTKHRRGNGRHWLMVSEIEAATQRPWREVDGTELHQAIAIARQCRELKNGGPAGAFGEPLATAPGQLRDRLHAGSRDGNTAAGR